MLANNFMTPSALGLSDVEFESLVKVLGMLERGEIAEEQFTMRRVQHPCRTPACLCGWANHVSGGRAFPLQEKPGRDDLFARRPTGHAGERCRGRCASCSAMAAVRPIRSTGDPVAGGRSRCAASSPAASRAGRRRWRVSGAASNHAVLPNSPNM